MPRQGPKEHLTSWLTSTQVVGGQDTTGHCRVSRGLRAEGVSSRVVAACTLPTFANRSFHVSSFVIDDHGVLLLMNIHPSSPSPSPRCRSSWRYSRRFLVRHLQAPSGQAHIRNILLCPRTHCCLNHIRRSRPTNQLHQPLLSRYIHGHLSPL